MADSLSSSLDEVENEKETSSIPESTKRSTTYGVNRFNTWLEGCGLTCDFHTVTCEDLNSLLRKFYSEIKPLKQGGTPLTPSSLTCIRAAIQRHLSAEPYNLFFNILKDKEFAQANAMFTATCKSYGKVGNKNPQLKQFIGTGDMEKLGQYFSAWDKNPADSQSSSLDEVEIEQETSSVPESTKRSTTYGINRFNTWLESSGLRCDFNTVTCEELNSLLRKFYAEIKPLKQGGTPLTPSSLTCIRAAIQRHLSAEPYKLPFNIIKNKEFKQANAMFIATCKSYAKAGNESPQLKRSIGSGDMEKLGQYFSAWDKNPDVLVEAVWFLICFHFGCRSRDGWTQMTVDTFALKEDNRSKQYLSMVTIEITKNHQGGHRRADIDYKDQRMYGPGVDMYKFMLSKMNSNCNRLFQTPLRAFIPEQHWYKNEPMGKNTFSTIMQRISKKAGLSQLYTCHCVRLSNITTLFHTRMTPLSIISITKHRRTASVSPYIDDVSAGSFPSAESPKQKSEFDTNNASHLHSSTIMSWQTTGIKSEPPSPPAEAEKSEFDEDATRGSLLHPPIILSWQATEIKPEPPSPPAEAEVDEDITEIKYEPPSPSANSSAEAEDSLTDTVMKSQFHEDSTHTSQLHPPTIPSWQVTEIKPEPPYPPTNGSAKAEKSEFHEDSTCKSHLHSPTTPSWQATEIKSEPQSPAANTVAEAEGSLTDSVMVVVPSIYDEEDMSNTNTHSSVQDSLKVETQVITVAPKSKVSMTKGYKKVFECEVCCKRYRKLHLMKRHVRTHTTKRTYACKFCSQECRNQRSLTVHERTHREKKLFVCVYCSKVFMQVSCLRLHERTHTGEKPFKCSQCDQRFTAKASLKRHQNIHTGEMPYKCDYCDMKFKRVSQQQSHQGKHRLPYECDRTDCRMKFISLSEIQAHMWSHPAVKPHECEVCGKKFRWPGPLKNHVRSHTRKRPGRTTV